MVKKKKWCFQYSFLVFLWDPPPKNWLVEFLYSIFIFNFQKKWIWIQKMNTTFQCFCFLWIWIQWHIRKYYKNKKVTFLFLVMWCVWVRKITFKKNKKQWPNPSIMYSILKLYIQNNLPNIINCENYCFFFYIQIQDLNIEYKK